MSDDVGVAGAEISIEQSLAAWHKLTAFKLPAKSTILSSPTFFIGEVERHGSVRSAVRADSIRDKGFIDAAKEAYRAIAAHAEELDEIVSQERRDGKKAQNVKPIAQAFVDILGSEAAQSLADHVRELETRGMSTVNDWVELVGQKEGDPVAALQAIGFTLPDDVLGFVLEMRAKKESLGDILARGLLKLRQRLQKKAQPAPEQPPSRHRLGGSGDGREAPSVAEEPPPPPASGAEDVSQAQDASRDDSSGRVLPEESSAAPSAKVRFPRPDPLTREIKAQAEVGKFALVLLGYKTSEPVVFWQIYRFGCDNFDGRVRAVAHLLRQYVGEHPLDEHQSDHRFDPVIRELRVQAVIGQLGLEVANLKQGDRGIFWDIYKFGHTYADPKVQAFQIILREYVLATHTKK